MDTGNNKDDFTVSVCANCGKEGSDVKNTCNKCQMVKYCNATCKKKHRSKHKKLCERRVAELHDIELFKQPPSPHGDCPICFLRMPTLHTGSKYMSCCGKTICSGCDHAPVYDDQGNEVDNQKCPFCRTTTLDTAIKRIMKRADADDPIAIFNLGCSYRDGSNKDYNKALELYHRAGELGFAPAYTNIGLAYTKGEGVEVDMKKAVHYFEVAAIGGDETARNNLGCIERDAGNMDRAVKHYMIGVRGGKNDSVEAIKELYKYKHVTKDDYTKALRSYQVYLSEIKSPQRDKAAADDDKNRYY